MHLKRFPRAYVIEINTDKKLVIIEQLEWDLDEERYKPTEYTFEYDPNLEQVLVKLFDSGEKASFKVDMKSVTKIGETEGKILGIGKPIESSE